MADSNFIIVSVVCGGDLYGSSAEFHIDDDRVRDNRESAIDERMDSEFSVKMLSMVQQKTRNRTSWCLQCT